MNVQILHERRDQLEADMRAIHDAAGNRGLTTSEQGRWNRLDAELREVRSALEAADAAAAERDRLAEQRAKWGSLKVGADAGRHYAASDVARMGDQSARTAARAILDDQRRASRRLEARQGDHISSLLTEDHNDPATDGGTIARMILLTETPEYRSAFQTLLTDPHPVFTAGEAQALRSAREFYRAMSVGTDAAGGYGIPAFLDPTIALTSQGSANPFLDIARVVTITTDQWKGVSSAGVTWSWDSEAEEVSDDTPTLAQPTIPVYSARGFVPFSIEVGMDYPNFAREVAGLLAEGYSELTAEAFATGSGSGQPTGVLTALDAVTTSEVVVTTDGTFSATDIDKVWSALPDRARGNATWAMSADVESYISLWGDAVGGRTADLGGNLTTLRGRPHVVSSYFPSFTGTTGAANILVVGDFKKGMTIAQRAGMTMELVPHLFGTTNQRPTGQRGYFAHARVGSDVVDDGALMLLQNQ